MVCFQAVGEVLKSAGFSLLRVLWFSESSSSGGFNLGKEPSAFKLLPLGNGCCGKAATLQTVAWAVSLRIVFR